MIALLDTSILIAVAAPTEDSPTLAGFDRSFASSLSWAELTKGLHTTASLVAFKARRARFDDLQRSFGEGVPFDDDCVAAYDVVLRRVTERRGSGRAHNIDRMIAATAMVHDMTVLTRDLSGFAGLEGLVRVELR